jgi:hypothetical protein
MRDATDRAELRDDELDAVSGGYLSFAVSTPLRAIGGAHPPDPIAPGDPIFPGDPVRG